MEHIQYEYDRGGDDAKLDIKDCLPKLYWQTRGQWGEFLTQLMADRFGVTVQHTSGITWAAKKSYEAGYNDAVRLHVDREFGQNAFKAALDEVDQFRHARYQKYFGES